MAYEDYGYVGCDFDLVSAYKIPDQETIDSDIDYLKKVSKHIGEDEELLISSYNLVDSECNKMMTYFLSNKQAKAINEYFELEDPNPDVNRVRNLIGNVFDRQRINFPISETIAEKPGSKFKILFRLFVFLSIVFIVGTFASLLFFDPLMKTNIGLSVDISSSSMFIISLSYLVLSVIVIIGSIIINLRLRNGLHENYFYYLIRSLIKSDSATEKFDTMITHSFKLFVCNVIYVFSNLIYFLFLLMRVFVLMNFKLGLMKLMSFYSTQPMNVFFANYLLFIAIFFLLNLTISLINIKLVVYNRNEKMEYFK